MWLIVVAVVALLCNVYIVYGVCQDAAYNAGYASGILDVVCDLEPQETEVDHVAR